MIAHPLASSASPEHFTPAWLVEKVLAVLGKIDLDPCSCEEANRVVGALDYFDRRTDGLSSPWRGRVFVNPPGDARGGQPKAFWRKLAEEVQSERVDAFVWLAFGISHLRTLQTVDDGLLGQCWLCVPECRIRFSGPSPTKDNAILYWGRDGDRFVAEFADVGIVWTPLLSRLHPGDAPCSRCDREERGEIPCPLHGGDR